jgi:hypothetical protein
MRQLPFGIYLAFLEVSQFRAWGELYEAGGSPPHFIREVGSLYATRWIVLSLLARDAKISPDS